MDAKLKDQLNFYIEFKDWYFQILEEFKFDYKKEYEARDYLAQILTKKSQSWKLDNVLNLFKERVLSKTALLIYGCGPSLENTIDIVFKKKGVDFFGSFINLTADGASIPLREKGIQIDAIFTDLDGITKNEFYYASFNIIHAHGDNIERLKFFKDEILKFENVIGTTQIEPLPNLLNPGGFTDGDRILYFLRTLLCPSHKLFLIGMDFGKKIGKYSKLDMKKNQEASPIKQKKLQYAIKLIKWLKDKIPNDIYFVNSEFIIKDFINLSIDEFLNIFNK
ncbi:MAG: 6-hydroxymethylpterin diphosphokinase MptE-like protein [Candidatus Hodarchaeota archaeon]